MKNWLTLFAAVLLIVFAGACASLVEVSSVPSGAEVFYNGEHVGQTPLEYRVKTFPYQNHQFITRLEGYKPNSVECGIHPPGKIELKLEKLAGKAVPTRPSHALSSLPVPETGKSGQRWAVVIGVSDYRDSRVQGLRYAAKDAIAFHDWLISPEGGRYAPANIKLLVNKDATGRNIREALYSWLRKAIAEDSIIIFFAGHGSPESPDNPENLFLLPYDTDYSQIASTGFPMWDIETALKRFIKAESVVVIADACHSGGIGNSFDIARRSGTRGMSVNPISSGLQNLSGIAKGICVISASAPDQLSQEGEQWGGGHGVFTYYLLTGLNGEADFNGDQSVTLGELSSFLSEQVRRATRNAQSPTVSGRYDPAMRIKRP